MGPALQGCCSRQGVLDDSVARHTEAGQRTAGLSGKSLRGVAHRPRVGAVQQGIGCSQVLAQHALVLDSPIPEKQRSKEQAQTQCQRKRNKNKEAKPTKQQYP